MNIKKIVSLLLAFAMIFGMVVPPSQAYAKGEDKFVEADYKVENVDGKSYKVYKFTDLVGKRKDGNKFDKKISDDDFMISEPVILQAVKSSNPDLGEEIPEAERYSVLVDWTCYDLQPGDLGTPVFFQIYDKTSKKRIAQTDNVTAKGRYKFKKLKEWNDAGVSHEPSNWQLKAPNEYSFDVRLRTGKAGRFSEETIKASILQRGMPIYRAEYYTNKSIPTIEVQRTNKRDNTADVPINSTKLGANQYYSWAEAISDEQKPYFKGKELDIKKYGSDTLMSLEVSDDITAGRVKMAMKAPGKTDFDRGPGTFTDNGTPYHYEVTGNYKEIHIFTIRQDLTVKFNANKGTWKSGNAPADQTIGHSMKLGDSWAGLGPINVPGESDLTPPAPIGNEKEKKFIGWNTDANAKTALFTDNTYAQPITKDGTFYAIYVEKPQGKVKVEYIDKDKAEPNKAIEDKYKYISTDENKDKDEKGVKLTLATKYPAEKFGNKDETVKQADLQKSAAPTFVGYKIHDVKTTVPPQGKDLTYTENGDYTIKYIYEKLPDFIPAKDDNGNDNTKVTEDVKATYKKVLIKVDSEKGLLQKNQKNKKVDLDKTEFLYYVNPVENKSLKFVVDSSGLSVKSKNSNANEIDNRDPWKFNPKKTKTNNPAEVQLSTKVNEDNFKGVDKVVIEANFKQTKADQLKDKLEAVPIKVWVDTTDTDGSKITWKNGVKLNDADKDDTTLKGLLAEATVTDLGENGTLTQPQTSRNSSKQNLPEGKKGNLKVAFDDGSALVVNDQMLYVAAEKNVVKPGEDNQIDPDKLPDGKVEVKFLLGEGVDIGNKSGDKDKPVLYTTYYVKPNTGLEKSDIPTTTLQENYKNNKWYNGTNELAEADYKTITDNKTFTAKAEQTDAKKYGDKLEAQDIVKWVGEQVDWKDGVETITGVTFKSVEDLSNRSTDTAGVHTGKLKVTFKDDSFKEINNQKLIVRAKKADKVTPNNDDPGTYPKDSIEVKFVAGNGIETLDPANKVMVLKSNQALEAADYPTVVVKDNYKNKTKNTDYYDVQPNTNLTAPLTTVTATADKKGTGSAKVEYHAGANDITAKIANLKVDGQTYPADNKLTGTEETAIDVAKITQPELLGYKKAGITTEPATDAKYTEAGTEKVIFNYEKIDDIIGPVKPSDKKPAGYVTVAFKATTGASLDPSETSYFVNPKADKKAKISKVGDNYQISGKKADGTDLTGNVPAVTSTDENKYEIQYADGEAKKWAYNNFDKVGKDITTDTTFTAKVIEFGKPSVEFPPVEIEKGETKVVTPDAKDKYGKKVEKPGKSENPDKIKTPDGVTVNVDKDGKIKIEVPKDYNGPGTFTIEVPYKIDEKEITGKIEVTIKEDKKPEPKPEPQPTPVPEEEYPNDFKVHEYVPTFPVYVSVPKKSVEDVKVIDKLWYIFHIDKYDYEEVRNNNSTSHKMDVTPVIRNERTMLPLRYVAEAIGADVKWDPETRTATFAKDGLIATIQIDSDEIVLSNGKTVKMDSKPLNINDRILVSVVNVGNVFGLTNGNTLDGVDQDIEWDHDTRTATIYIRR